MALPFRIPTGLPTVVDLPELNVTAAINNGGQTLAADVEPIAAFSVALVNAAQSLSAAASVEIDVDVALANIGQVLAADVDPVATFSAALANTAQALAAITNVEVDFDAAIENAGQVFLSTVQASINTSVALTGGGQTLAAFIDAIPNQPYRKLTAILGITALTTD